MNQTISKAFAAFVVAVFVFSLFTNFTVLAEENILPEEQVSEETTLVEETLPTEPEEIISEEDTTSNENEEVAPEENTETSEPEVLGESTEQTDSTTTSTEEETTPTPSLVLVTPTPTLTTDKDDYHPGETATIFGNLFGSLQSIILKIFGSDENSQNYTESIQNVTANEAGSFVTTYTLDNLYRPFYEVVATDLIGNILAGTWFRDGAIGTYDQCSNDDGDGYASGDTGCRWINGNLNSNNSTYFEGDATVQRSWMRGYAPGSAHTLTFRYGTTKAGTHAYDYLTNWNYSEGWVSLADRCDGITNCTGVSVPETTFVIPDDPNVPNTIEPLGSPTRDMVMRGGTITGISAPTIVSGTYAGDSETEITVSFTVDPSDGANDMCTTSGGGPNAVTSCDVAFWFGAHVAKTSEWSAHNGTTGAGFISGSPYHVQLAAEDGSSIGNRDNQMQSNALPSQIIIRKVTDPVNDPQTFTFTKTGNGNGYTSPYNLTHGGSNSQTVTPKNNQNTYIITEGAVPQWNLTNISCQDNSSVTTTTVNLANRQVTIVLDIDSSSIVDCTFTNTKVQNGTIIVDKITNPGSDTQSFSFDASGGSYADFNLTDAATPNSQVLVAGTYAVSEGAVSGWTNTSATCSSTQQGDTSTPGNISLQAGETITCTFTNTKQGKILVDKVTVPGGSSQSFEFDPSWSANNFNLTDASAAADSGFLNPGNYSVSEVNIPAGWTLTNSTCSDGSTIGNISLQAGETVTCTFTNTQQGKIVIEKQTLPDGSSQSFTFNPSYGSNFGLTDGQQNTSAFLNPGNYSVSETLPTGWTQTSAICSDGSLVGNISLQAGETVTCVFTNTQNGHIVVNKVTIPAHDSQSFQFNTAGLGYSGFSLTDDSAPNDQEVAPGKYSVSETVPEGWAQTAVVCTSGETIGDIDVEPGETVTCTFENTKQGKIIVDKITNPAGSNQSFEFDPSWAPNFNLTDAAAPVESGFLAPGTYSVNEVNIPSDWILSNVTCSDGSDPANILLNPGETITCTLTNTQKGHIIVDKVTDPQGDSASFEFDPSWSSNFFLQDTTLPVDSGALLPGNYSVAEIPLTGWDLTSATCSDGSDPSAITLGAGETVTCTFNNQKDSFIIVDKVTNPAQDSTEFDFNPSWSENNFTLTDEGTPVNSGDLAPGNYSVAELAETGWDLASATCTGNGNTPASINLTAGQTVTCTFENTKRGEIILVKNTIGGDGSFDFVHQIAGLDSNLTTVAGTDSDTSDKLVPGDYSISETVPSGWDLTSATCDQGETIDNITVGAGETVTCTFTNTKHGKIIIEKQTLPDGAQGSFNFTGEIATSLVDGGTAEEVVTPGTHFVRESVPSGWLITDITCEDPTTDSSGFLPEAEATFNVSPGETVKCTFTNTQKGHIIVDKVTDPSGDEQVFQFDAFPSQNGYADFTLTDAQNPNDQELAPGNYSVTEFVPQGWDLTSTSCVSSIQDVETVQNLELDPGETISCTFNNQKDANIIVEKQTLPNGSLASFEFDSSWGANFSLTDGQQNDSGDINPGTYNIDELTPAGWDETSAICSSTQQGDASTPGNISLQAGETVTCVFTNTQRGHIIIEKNAIPDSSQEFTFNNNFANGNPAVFGLIDDNTPGLPNFNAEVLPGTYVVSENPVEGWQSPESVSCSDGSEINAINVDPGETVTCTFVNEKLATIILVKNTVGGNDTFDFTMTGAGLPPSVQLTTVGGTDQEAFPNLDPDNAYSISENAVPAGWAANGASCDNGDPVNNITPNAGEVITCTFTNNKPAAQIDLTPLTDTNKIGDNHVITATVQTHNGNEVWGPAADGTTVTFAITNSNGATATFVGGNTCNTVAGACSITINSPTSGHVVVNASTGPAVLGVTVNVATGTGGDNSADAQKDYVNAQILIAPLAATNEVGDDHPFVVTVKADNGDGSGFQPVVGAIVNAIVSPNTALDVSDCNAGTDVNGECTVVVNSNAAGVFTITARSTINVSGLEFKLQTNGAGANSGPAVKTYVDANISLTPGDATNNVNDPHVITATVMENDGNGFVPASGETVTFTLPVNTAGAVFVGPDTCITNGAGQCPVTINTATPGLVEIHGSADVGVSSLVLHRESDESHGSSGDAKKTYVAGKIIVVKQTLPDGSETSFEFDPSWNTNFFLKDGENNNSDWIAPGQYNVSEVVPAGWDLTSSTCDDGSLADAINLAAGETVTCTFTNTQRGHLIVEKTTQPSGDTTQFTINTTGTGTITGGGAGVITDVTDKDYEVTPGTYSVTETVPAGWEKTVDTCQGVVVAAGETKTCGITNVKKGSITIVKDADPNDCQDFTFARNFGANFLLDDDANVAECDGTNQPESQQFTGLSAVSPNNVYTVTENLPNQFWKLDAISCSQGSVVVVDLANKKVTITLQPGQDVTCTFQNDKISPTRTQGFWQTHLAYTTSVFTNPTHTYSWFTANNMKVGSGLIGGSQDPITTIGQVFGGFHSNIAKKSTGQQRIALDKARMQLAQQLIAAKLNCAAFGCPASIQAMIVAADSAYAGNNANAILAAAAQMDAFNNSGDTIVVGNTGKADPKTAKAGANYLFWDTP